MRGRAARAGSGVLACALAACGGGGRPASLVRPSAVIYDARADVYLVADTGAGQQQGGVREVSPQDGAVRALVPSEVGLRAPRGLAVVRATLWVTDVDALRGFDRATGAPTSVIEIPGAKGLWGLTAGEDGTLYVSDAGLDVAMEPTGTDAIWKVAPGGAPEVLARGEALAHPTAISAQRGGIYAVSWRDGTFFQVDYRGVMTALGRAPAGGLSGLCRVAGAPQAGDPRQRTPSWLAASQDGAAVYRFSLTGGVEALPVRVEQPGGIACDSLRRRLLVPLYDAGRLLVEPL